MSRIDHYDVSHLLHPIKTELDFVIDGIHFGRGDEYINEKTSQHFRHKTISIQTWKIIDKNLQEIDKETQNEFLSTETYIIQWKTITEELQFETTEILSKRQNEICFYWKGEDATKGFSPLPEFIEKENPPVERIVQWSEPPVFLQLFSGNFIVNKNTNLNVPHLYILRGELQKEIHLYEVDLKKENLRSRTSFFLHFPKEKKSIIWHGNKSSLILRIAIKKIVENNFRQVVEIEEDNESEEFVKAFQHDSEYFVVPKSKIIDYTLRLFYLNKITGSFSAAEIENSHKSEFLTPFPFLQSHLYTADQPAIFLLDDNDEIWIWYGWNRDEDDDFKSECFIMALNYAKQKSKMIEKLVKVHKVVAGFEPIQFTNLFPNWKKREDVVEIQKKDGVLPNLDTLMEIISH